MALNAERRQRFGRPVFKEKNHTEEEAAPIDVGEPILFKFDKDEDETGTTADKSEDQYQEYQEGEETLPCWVRGRHGQVFYWAARGLSTSEIAEQIGLSDHRVAQMLRDKDKILEVVAEAQAQGALFDENELPELDMENAPAPLPRKNKPRIEKGKIQQVSLFEDESLGVLA